MSERADTLPDLSSDHPVTADQADSYRRDGHIHLRGVCSATEIAAYRPHIKAAMDRVDALPQQEFDGELDIYGRAFTQRINLWTRREQVKRLVHARRFAKIAADLMGVDRVRLYHDQALFKEAGGGFTPWHQDHFYWPMDTHDALTMWMPLVDVSTEMGTMTFASGSHTEGSLDYPGDQGISAESESYYEDLVREKGYRLTDTGAMAAGDATFHASWSLHKAPPNQTDRSREAFAIIFFADGVRIKTPENENQQMDLDAFFPGQAPGQLAGSELNPLLFSR